MGTLEFMKYKMIHKFERSMTMIFWLLTIRHNFPNYDSQIFLIGHPKFTVLYFFTKSLNYFFSIKFYKVFIFLEFKVNMIEKTETSMLLENQTD